MQKTFKTQKFFVDFWRGSLKDLYFQTGHFVLLQDVHSFSQVTDSKLCQEVTSYKTNSRNQVLKSRFWRQSSNLETAIALIEVLIITNSKTTCQESGSSRINNSAQKQQNASHLQEHSLEAVLSAFN